MNFQPLGNRTLVERMEESATTASGIIIPDNAKEKPSQGKVIAIGKDVEHITVDDIVFFGKYTGNEISIEGKKYLIIEADDIYGIMK